MRGGLATSVVLHAAILAWALFTIQAQREMRLPDPEPIAVDLVNSSELTRLRQGARNAKQLEAQPKESPKTEPVKKEAPKPTPVAAAPPPPPPPAPEPPPPPKEEPKEEPKKEVASIPPPAPEPPPPAAVPPVPAPDEQKKLDDLLKEQERQAEEQKKARSEQKKIEDQKRLEEERKQAELKKKQEDEKKRKEAELKKKREEEKKRKEAEAKKKQFDAETIAALLNKVPDKGGPRPSVPLDEQAKSMNKGPVLGAPEGRDSQISASERAVLAQIIRACVQSKWNLSAGGEDAMNMVIKLRLQFRPDGTLSVAPQVTNPQNTPYFLAASEGAVRAAQACEPYSLPSEKYEAWRDVLMTFSLRDMLR